ncbi:MAG: ABC transporter permease [Chloroflexi bacterium]|nr:ABC transporter permease [Chloroflexota bacterium]
MKRLSLPYLVIQNIKRRPYRTAAIVLSVAIAIGTLFAITLTMRGVQNSLQVGLARLGADLIVVPRGQHVSAQEAFVVGQPTTFYMNQSVQDQVAKLPGVERVSSQVFVKTLTNASCCVGEFFLVSFDPRTDFTIYPWLTSHLEGHTLRSDEILVGDRILLFPGETALFYGSAFKIVAVLEATGMGLDRTVFVPLDGLREMIAASPERAEQALTIAPNQISTVLVRVEPGTDQNNVAELIESKIPDVQAITTSRMTFAVNQQFSGLLQIIFVVTASLWIMALIVIALIFTLSVNERQRELGLLRAMGAHKRFVLRLIIGEAMLLTGLGGVIGLCVSGALLLSYQGLLEQRLHIPFLLPSWFDATMLISGLLGLAIVSGAIASFQPAFRISRLEPYEAVRQGS